MNKNIPDKYQQMAIESIDNVLLIAPAGSGKTYTITKKIEYLIHTLGILPNEILVISFTNKSVNDLKNRIKENVNIYTFHKLAIDILKYNNIYFNVINNNYLLYIIEEYFYSLKNELLIKSIIKRYHYYDYNSFLKSKDFHYLKNLIARFINLYKTNNKNIKDILVIYHKDNLVITLIINILSIYNNELKSINSFDYDDLIINAYTYANNYKDFKYIIIDEFQDTSLIRWNLIYKILINNKAKIFCVGDDYQSIYKFSGSDINLFLDFTKNVNNSKIMYLKYTYRNSQELINIASNFINKNNNQLTKDIISNKHIQKPIKIYSYINKKKCLKRLLNKLIEKYNDILILGRNNFDIDKYLIKDYIKDKNGFFYKKKYIRYMSVHSSKGLEADVVIIINLENNLYGFPNKIANPIIINDINYNDSSTILEEERRLFYVALTRSKNEVYLLTPLLKKSIFVKEIKKLIKNDKF